MKEKLVIKNFGPIKSVELELGRFNVLIGNQGTGKSTVAKLLIAIHSTIFRELFDLKLNSDLNIKTQYFLEYLRIVGIGTYLNDETIIDYNSTLYSLSYQHLNINIDEKRNFSFEESLSFDFTYIPSERNLAITLSDSLFALIETGTALPQLFTRFGNKFQRARKESTVFNYQSILGVKYLHKEGRDLVLLPAGKEISIHDASSGIQGNIALLTVFDYVTNSTFRKENLLVIEEPELNLFPETQNKLVQHFIEKGNKNQILLTTHSPYILTSLNNMMYAWQIGQNHSEEVGAIMEKKYWINPEEVSAYMMLSDGTCENILDRKEGMIEAEKIDGISGELNKQFDQLIEIEHNDLA
ncbi:MAG: AAA family ATPase [Phycisphaerales bacterium]|nr:AAA family ATPase [Phycisphaerales bacterium]